MRGLHAGVAVTRSLADWLRVHDRTKCEADARPVRLCSLRHLMLPKLLQRPCMPRQVRFL